MNRRPDYLRISLTDRCNLRCIYCHPGRDLGAGHTLGADGVLRLARLAASCGIRKVRLTGGEPLLHPELLKIVRGLRKIDGIGTIGLTTNGVLLHDVAAGLRDAGLSSVNISLPSLRPDVFAGITDGGNLGDVLRGIEAASREGFAPVKLNTVVMRGINDAELTEFALLARNNPFEVRFIEFMPFRKLDEDYLVPNDELLERLRSLGRIRPVPPNGENATASVYRIEGFRGRIGFISPMSHPMCARCNRIRLTAAGRLRACLVEGGESDVRPFMNDGIETGKFAKCLTRCAALKPARHSGSFRGVMTCIGG